MSDLRMLDQRGTRVVFLFGNATRRAVSAPRALKSGLSRLAGATRELLAIAPVASFRFERGSAWLNDHLLRTGGGMGLQLTQLHRLFVSKGLGGLRVNATLQPKQWAQALARVINAPARPQGEDGAAELQAGTGIPGLSWLAARPPSAKQLRRRGQLRAAGEIDAYGRALALVGAMYIEDGGLEAFAHVAQELVSAAVRDPRHLISLAVVPMAVAYELRHPVNTTIFALALGRKLNLNRGALLDLALCALACDTGMANVPRAVLEKAGSLSSRELEFIHRHPIDSVRRVMKDPSLDSAMRRRLIVAFEHHIESHGRGYPKVFGWDRQHLYSRIISIADSYDAMIVSKPWRAALLPAEAVAQMVAEAGGRLDPALVVTFARMMGRHPVGSTGLLDTGEVGVVHAASDPERHPGSPTVRLLTTAEGGRRAEAPVVDLCSDPRVVLRSIDPAVLGIDALSAVFGGLTG